jgi:hypothetical protein
MKQDSDTMKAGHEFVNALRNAAERACDERSVWNVYYYMRRANEIEGTLRTIKRIEGE